MDQRIINLTKRVKLKNNEFLVVLYPESDYDKKEAEGEIEVNRQLKMTQIEDKWLIDATSHMRYIILKDNKGYILSLADEVLSAIKSAIESTTKVKVREVKKKGDEYEFILDEYIRPEKRIKAVLEKDFFYTLKLFNDRAETTYYEFNMIFLSKIKERYRRIYDEVLIEGNYAKLINYIEVS